MGTRRDRRVGACTYGLLEPGLLLGRGTGYMEQDVTSSVTYDERGY